MLLETERLVIRETTAKDVEFLATIQTNDTVQRHIGGVIDSFENTVAHILKHPENLGGFRIITLKENGTSVGAIAFVPNNNLNENEILIELLPEQFGKGYGSEALSAIREWWIMTNKVEHMYATVKPENTASIALLEKCGFQLIDEYQNTFEPKQLVFKYERSNTQ